MSFVNANITTLTEKVGKALLQKKLKLVTAESCTGGGLAYAITQIPGSSNWFERGFVTYSNEAKHELLKVSQQTLTNFGAVSEQTAAEMARGALENSHADVSISVTGIAGPDGGSKEKPVGMVWFGFAGKNLQHKTILQHFSGNREEIRLKSIEFTLTTVLSLI